MARKIVRALLSARLGVRSAFVNVRGGGAVDQETEEFRPAVVAARVHHLLALVDQGEIDRWSPFLDWNVQVSFVRNNTSSFPPSHGP